MFGSKTFNADTDIPDLSGKVVIVTGGNNGLGKACCQKLAQHKAHVYLAARTPAKAEVSIREIKNEVPDAKISFLELDLTSFHSIHNAAEAFNASSKRLNILLNNAGVMAMPPSTTKEGYEIQFGTNHVGHALFTKLLLPTLERTANEKDADVRIVNVSSAGHQLCPKGGLVLSEAITNMQTYSTWTRYGQSKLANILFTRELARRYPGIKSMALHPGGVDTGLKSSLLETSPWLKYIVPGVRWFLKSPEEGALTQLFTATSPDAKSGEYYEPVAIQRPGSKCSQDPELAKELWNWTETELAKHGY